MNPNPTTPPAPQIDLAALVDGLASQGELFSDSGAPVFRAEDATLLRTAGEIARRPDAERYSARNASRDERRCLQIAALTMLGWSHRKIAATVRCDKRLIAPVVERLERDGVLPPLESRVRRAEAELREQTIRWAEELVQDGTVSRDNAAMLRGLFTGAGILADKQAAQNGFNGVNLSVQIGVAVGSDPGNWKAVVAQVSPPSDSESEPNSCKSMGYDGSAPCVAGLVATPDPIAAPLVPPADAVPMPSSTHPDLTQEGGGGRRSGGSDFGSIRRPPQQSQPEAP